MIQNNEKPYLAVAAICERVLTEKDGVLSAIRFVDRLEVSADAKEAPEKMPTVPISLTALISFKSGLARGKRTLRVPVNTPKGDQIPSPQTFTLLFTDETPGTNVLICFVFGAEVEGWYWFDVVLDDEIVTRMPLQVIYKRGPAANQQLQQQNQIDATGQQPPQE